jgi:hypothetical protein
MRTFPLSLEQSGTAAHYSIRRAGSTVVNCSAIPSLFNASEFGSFVTLTFASGLTAGEAVITRSANADAFLGWSAEL